MPVILKRGKTRTPARFRLATAAGRACRGPRSNNFTVKIISQISQSNLGKTQLTQKYILCPLVQHKSERVGAVQRSNYSFKGVSQSNLLCCGLWWQSPPSLVCLESFVCKTRRNSKSDTRVNYINTSINVPIGGYAAWSGRENVCGLYARVGCGKCALEILPTLANRLRYSADVAGAACAQRRDAHAVQAR